MIILAIIISFLCIYYILFTHCQKLLCIFTRPWSVLYGSRLILATYCMRYPHAVPFFKKKKKKKKKALFFTKTSKNTCHLGGCSILNVLNSEKWRVKIHYCALSLNFLALICYTAHMPLFSRISPAV